MRSKPADRSSSVTPLLPVDFKGTATRFARGVRAGRWCFATGQSAIDHVSGIAPEVLQSRHPFQAGAKATREANRIFANVEEVLAAAGTGFSNVVRIDQYYTNEAIVDPYHEVRRQVFRGTIPPSTSNLQRRFLRANQDIEVQIMAAIPNDRFEVRHQSFKPNYQIHRSSGYSPALCVGDYRFIPGQTAEARNEGEGPIDPEACMPPGHLWKGTPVKLETNFIVRSKLVPSLEAVGASLESVVKAQVYLRDRADVPAFSEAWLAHFKSPPATTIIPTATPGFIVPESRIEINTISIAASGETKKERIDAGGTSLFDGYPAAIRAGDLLFLSGLMAVDKSGLIEAAEPDEREPYIAIPIKAEIASIAAHAKEICRAAGTSLTNLVRLQAYHADLRDFAPALEAWHQALDGQPLPISAIEVPWLPVPGARVLVDLWVYAP